jgi:hypothetical protein
MSDVVVAGTGRRQRTGQLGIMGPAGPEKLLPGDSSGLDQPSSHQFWSFSGRLKRFRRTKSDAKTKNDAKMRRHQAVNVAQNAKTGRCG